MSSKHIKSQSKDHSTAEEAFLPVRSKAPSGGHDSQHPSAANAKSRKSATHNDLARVRESLGFSDIPTGSQDDEGLRDILGAWLKKSFHLDHPDNKLHPVYTFFSQKKYRSWKDDLIWALRADMDDDADKPAAKKTVQPPVIDGGTPRRRVARLPEAPKSPDPKASNADEKSIEINIDFGSLPKLPKLSSLEKPLRNLLGFIKSRKYIAMIAAAVLVVGGFVTNIVINENSATSNKGKGISSQRMEDSPEFGTVVPNGKSVTDLGGWNRISPPQTAPVFAYADKINKVDIAVSQQVLPDNFKTNTDAQVAKLAKDFSATDKISTSDGTTVYVGTSARGPQSAILTKNNLLIFIKAQSELDDKTWATYVDSLVSPVPSY